MSLIHLTKPSFNEYQQNSRSTILIGHVSDVAICLKKILEDEYQMVIISSFIFSSIEFNGSVTGYYTRYQDRSLMIKLMNSTPTKWILLYICINHHFCQTTSPIKDSSIERIQARDGNYILDRDVMTLTVRVNGTINKRSDLCLLSIIDKHGADWAIVIHILWIVALIGGKSKIDVIVSSIQAHENIITAVTRINKPVDHISSLQSDK